MGIQGLRSSTWIFSVSTLQPRASPRVKKKGYECMNKVEIIRGSFAQEISA